MMKRKEFQSFYKEWMKELGEILHQLHALRRNRVAPEMEHRAVVHKTLEHFRAYYAANFELVREDVRSVLSPPWLSSFERFLLWMGGWRPTSLLGMGSGVLRDDQEVEKMRREVRKKEEEAEEEMRRVQGGVLGLVNVERGSVEEGWVMEEVVKGVERVVVKADRLRMEMMGRVAGGMSPVQAVEFLGAVVGVIIQLHVWGLAADGGGCM